jgi:hypothetical protein
MPLLFVNGDSNGSRFSPAQCEMIIADADLDWIAEGSSFDDANRGTRYQSHLH